MDYVEINEPMRRFVEFRLDRLSLAGGVFEVLQLGLAYDVVLCFDVVGHLEHAETMRDICAAVAPGGELVVTWDNWGDGMHEHKDYDFKGLLHGCGLVEQSEMIWGRP